MAEKGTCKAADRQWHDTHGDHLVPVALQPPAARYRRRCPLHRPAARGTDRVMPTRLACREVASVGVQRAGPVALTWDHQGLRPISQTERLLPAADASQEEIDSRFLRHRHRPGRHTHRVGGRTRQPRMARPVHPVGHDRLDSEQQRIHTATLPGPVLRPGDGAPLQLLPAL